MSAARSAPGHAGGGAVGTTGPPAWGFHRLSPDAARHVVRAAAIRPGDLVVDLGAGHGVLTSALLDAGARVVAVELHPARVAVLRERFAHAT